MGHACSFVSGQFTDDAQPKCADKSTVSSNRFRTTGGGYEDGQRFGHPATTEHQQRRHSHTARFRYHF